MPDDDKEPVAATASKDRTYGIYVEESIDLSADDATLAAQVRRHAIPDKQADIAVLVRIGRVMSSNPKNAVKLLGDKRDLNGDYEAIPETSRTKFPNLKTQTERTVTFG